MHEYFFETAFVDYIIKSEKIIKRNFNYKNKLIEKLRSKNKPGLILFSSGTTSKPKAILHDFSFFLHRFKKKRKALITLNFLVFDHIGGLNTFFHTIFNKGTIVSLKNKNVSNVINTCKKFKIELLPTTPTFLKMLSLIDKSELQKLSNLKIITYGTEMMNQKLLLDLCKLLPNIDFRQTYGMSEIGIMRVKSKSKKSLFVSIGGEGIKIKIVKKILFIKSKFQMIGYLNAENPFDKDGWFNSKDIVEKKNGFIKIIGRVDNIINVGGLKFMASEVQEVANSYKYIKHTKILKKTNPITGQHIELLYQVTTEKLFNFNKFKEYLSKNLPKHMVPKRIIEEKDLVNHRFKIK